MLERAELPTTFFADEDAPPVEWKISDGLTDYDVAVAFMEERVAKIAAGEAHELVWLVEHPPLLGAALRIQGHRHPKRSVGLQQAGPGAAEDLERGSSFGEVPVRACDV